MLMIVLLRILLIAATVLIIYTVIQFMMNPRRKLDKAHDQREYYLLDDTENIKQNFLLTYKGIMFEGEKYLGTTEESFEVLTIYVSARQPERLKGLERNDLYFMEEKILQRYPFAKIEWKNPINRLNVQPVSTDKD
ncbi:sigma-w pathway protein ysdB [Halobacillus massiliensis]|uniref:sigma-w pathway protein ysdB n=1 Tax=Halobacillus massiliensis TaxID=1926286 RepID=UPI0009E404FD